MNKVTTVVEDRPTVPEKQMNPAWAVAQSVATKFLTIALNAATGIISARALMPAGRGELAIMVLWPVFLASALTLGIPSALTFQLKRNPSRQSELLGAALLMALLTSLLAIVIGLVLVPHWISHYSPRAVLFAQLYLFSAPLTSLLLVGRAAMESRSDFSSSNKLLLWSPALTTAWLVVLLFTHSMTPYNAAAAYVVVGVVPSAIMLYQLWRMFAPSLHSLWSSTRLLSSYGIRSYGIDLCGTMALYVDQALVVRVLEPKLMGIYVVALSLSRMLNVFHTSVIMVLFPKAVSRTPEAVRDMTSRSVRMSTLLTSIAGLGIIILGPQVLTLLYGAEYQMATAVLRILVVEVVLSGATLVLAQAFMALGRPGIVTALQVTGLLLTVPLVVLLTPRFGIVGAGLALLISTTTRLLFVLLSFPIFLKMRIPGIVPKWSDISFMLGTISRRLAVAKNRGILAAADGTD
ncbi:MAG TPA: polysaccharide biosynthesis C-terminal domain-containing protein [Candidatus Saccharimonadales bacterium]|nr:polysaccharide biosynthesis C-terminal domain-containing protein [Candidatus Saccharimonadales bacterium]